MNRLREARKQKGISQFHLAVKANLYPSIISNIERGVWVAYPGWRQRIAAALEMPESEIFPEGGVKNG